MTTIVIPEPLVHAIEELRQAGLVTSAEEFAEQAICEKLSAARRDRLTLQSQDLQQDLATAGLTPAMLLHEFERFRHVAHDHR